MNPIRPLRFMRFILIVAVMAVVTACTGEAPVDEQGATRLLKEYYQYIQADDLDHAVGLYQEKDRATWKAFLQNNQMSLGKLKQYQIDHMEMNTVFSGVYFVFTIDAQYDKHEATEIITIFQEVDQKHPWLDYHKTKLSDVSATM
ncbi:MAG: hypothetical protein GC138_01280 [Gammaproteobacteria bacterium]|nr:hypothetical protein [Gammaproteobacteria bacterium]